MSGYQIAVVVGSLRRDSFNRKLATAIVKLAPPEFSFKQVQIGDLPLYNQDDAESLIDFFEVFLRDLVDFSPMQQCHARGLSRRLFLSRGCFCRKRNGHCILDAVRFS